MNEPEGEETIFAEALRLPPEERAAYLAQATTGNAELRRRVESLLGSYKAGDFLEQAAASELCPTRHVAVPLTEKAGDTIGRYKLLQQIGEGGCGVVYMAEQAEPVRRRVALKIIKLGMDTKSVIARFEAERQAVAMMDHPNIAKVFDAGATATGRPYFVMELVRGMKITDYCDEAKLSTRARLDLFIQVCQAIQHAHQKGIIHRDIKPSNILVSANDGVLVPKVIDFGIAKATSGQQLTDKTLFTAFEQFIGTPAYMSPEQAVITNVDIDTRSDIYALGVLLYEMLTGKTPFDAKELLAIGLDEMRRTIREQEPPRPSTRLSTLSGQELSTAAQRRGLDAPKLVSELRGDLDWIVMKALEKDRARRYVTANGLAADVQRHLNNEPVIACPPNTVYRFQKLFRRNRVVFTAASAVAVALLVGAAVSTWMFFQERAALRRAVAAEREQRYLRQQAETAEVNEAKLRLDAEAAGSNEVRLRLEAETARTNEARLRRQAEIAERTAQAEASQLGDALMRLGSMDQAEKFIRYSLTMQRKLGSNDSPEVAASLNNLAHVLIQQGTNFADAEIAAREALALRRKLLGDNHPDTANALDRLGYALYRQRKYSEAEAANYEALGIRREAFGDENLAVTSSLLNLSSVFRAEGKIIEAENSLREVLRTGRKLLGNENDYVTSVLNILGQMLFDNGKAAEAEPLIRECFTVRQKNRPNDWLTFTAQSLLGAILLNQRNYPDAERLLVSCCEGMEQHQDKVPGQMKQVLYRLIQLYESTERLDVAAKWRQKLSEFDNAQEKTATGQGRRQ